MIILTANSLCCHWKHIEHTRKNFETGLINFFLWWVQPPFYCRTAPSTLWSYWVEAEVGVNWCWEIYDIFNDHPPLPYWMGVEVGVSQCWTIYNIYNDSSPLLYWVGVEVGVSQCWAIFEIYNNLSSFPQTHVCISSWIKSILGHWCTPEICSLLIKYQATPKISLMQSA